MFSFPVRGRRGDLYSPRRGTPSARGLHGHQDPSVRGVRCAGDGGDSGHAERTAERAGTRTASTCARRRRPCPQATTTIKWPVIATVDPSPFDPCRDIPLDVIQRIGLGVHPARARGQPALPLRRGQLPDGGRGVRLAHLRAEPAARRGRTRHRRPPRGPVLGDEADRLEQPLVDHLHDRVQDRLRA